MNAPMKPGEAFGPAVDPYRFGKLPADLLDRGLFLTSISLACALGVSLRLIGPLFIVIPVGTCLCYAVLRSTMPPRLLSIYFAFCLLVAVLSEYRLFPSSWQVHFMDAAIIRQLIPLLGLFAVAWASKAYFRRRLLNGDVFFGARSLLFLSVVVAPALMLVQGRQYQGDDAEYTMLASFGAFINNNLVAFFFIMGAVFLLRDWRRYVALAAILSIAATTHFIQFRLLTLAICAALLGVPGRLAVIFVIVLLPTVYAIGIGHIPDVMAENQNSGIRLAFVSDAISSAVDTYGIGVGYGKESVKWRYEFPNMPVFTFLPDPLTMTPERMLEALSTGVENSFVESLLRTGVLGFTLFLAAFFIAFPPRELPRDVRNHAAFMFALMFIGCFVNSALESPISVVGHGFIYGYLLALRGGARRSIFVG